MRSILLPILALCASCTANLLGPVYPAPQDLSSKSSKVAAGWNNLTSVLHKHTTSNESPLHTLTFSVGLFSTHDRTAEAMQFHYTSSEISQGPNGTRKVDGNSIYRVASLTKLFTVFAGLLELGEADWERPLTKLFPAFAANVKARKDHDSVYSTPWDQITPSALAAQISGIARDGIPWDGGDVLLQYLGAILTGQTPNPLFDPATYGLPPLDQSEVLSLSPCLADGNTTCDGSLYTKGIAKNAPVYLPWTGPEYSNNGFILLGLAIANLTGKPLEKLYQEAIFDPLDMRSTTSDPPAVSTLSRSVIAGDYAINFGAPGGISKSSGGIFSTINDLAKFGTAILNSTLLPADRTRRWMKPVSHTTDLHYSVGRPWEIYRYKHPKSGVITDLYTKLGDSGNYGSFLVLLPDFNAGFSIIGASALSSRSNATNLLADLVTEAILPALMDQAAHEAGKNYAGRYVTDRLNSSLTLAVGEASTPGLSITSWVSNGTNLMPVLALPLGGLNARLVPTIVSDNKIAFRPYTVTQEAKKGLFSSNFDVSDWLALGSGSYAASGLGHFVFNVDKDGKAKSVELPAWNVTLNRHES
ncbi:serine hydrolase domain-containing protein [Aspergillus clavatus NRRL 1]|uniref:Beta-lactamase family protein n=1 Tax=Aspergillus clavatus (strain ATCC 1007 / CBS 513.65 / DSM 816 / NCTC 3887 / NRRL 1 / QM 1276 / 107) TaxID=344612 RepID=A1CIW6_ASPCL|nr:beta-lactamase family protein [Aspergillus clavatus NRRL 1]EAW10821.1 beta-lactamase family protein [Aspergillus clavatus NRRL 1]